MHTTIDMHRAGLGVSPTAEIPLILRRLSQAPDPLTAEVRLLYTDVTIVNTARNIAVDLDADQVETLLRAQATELVLEPWRAADHAMDVRSPMWRCQVRRDRDALSLRVDTARDLCERGATWAGRSDPPWLCAPLQE